MCNYQRFLPSCSFLFQWQPSDMRLEILDCDHRFLRCRIQRVRGFKAFCHTRQPWRRSVTGILESWVKAVEKNPLRKMVRKEAFEWALIKWYGINIEVIVCQVCALLREADNPIIVLWSAQPRSILSSKNWRHTWTSIPISNESKSSCTSARRGIILLRQQMWWYPVKLWLTRPSGPWSLHCCSQLPSTHCSYIHQFECDY